ncbi:recombinase family protein [Derxia gummosa]|uniref:Recombinase family protein n=1 Tax=Derxia gummosa DSM 723 TaxID=1121388 RepID=A0A8B6X8R8_9BURK|nr:recombinase family protein [Derxia gummosa]
MNHRFGYGRVSTTDQTAENQRLELAQAGHEVDQWFADVGVSGKVSAMQRPEFARMVGKFRKGDALIVSKLDRLGRDALDVQQTVRDLSELGVRVVVLNLGGTDLTSSAGKLMLAMLSAVAEMERDLLIERTQAGLARAKLEGTKLGRRPKTSEAQRADIRARLEAGATVSELAREYGISRGAVIDIRDPEKVAARLAAKEQRKGGADTSQARK